MMHFTFLKRFLSLTVTSIFAIFAISCTDGSKFGSRITGKSGQGGSAKDSNGSSLDQNSDGSSGTNKQDSGSGKQSDPGDDTPISMEDTKNGVNAAEGGSAQDDDILAALGQNGKLVVKSTESESGLRAGCEIPAGEFAKKSGSCSGWGGGSCLNLRASGWGGGNSSGNSGGASKAISSCMSDALKAEDFALCTLDSSNKILEKCVKWSVFASTHNLRVNPLQGLSVEQQCTAAAEDKCDSGKKCLCASTKRR